MSSTLESYELIRFAEAFEARLATAEEMVVGRPGLEAEKQWLASALERLREAREPAGGLLEQVKDLPELDEAREEFSFDQQGRWVDALEKLHAGITFTASSRAPVIEALFPHLKFPQLRRAPLELVNEYATSYERRLKSAYVTRIFSRDDFAMVRPVVDQVAATFAAWTASLTPTPLPPEQEAALREALVALGRRLDVALRQGRLLAEAALVPVPGVFEAAGLTLKPRKRAGKSLALSAEDGASDLFGEEGDAGQEEAFEGTEEASGEDPMEAAPDEPEIQAPLEEPEPVAEAGDSEPQASDSGSEDAAAAAEPVASEAPVAPRPARRGRPPKNAAPVAEPAQAEAPSDAPASGAPEAVRPKRRKKTDPSEAGTP
ncbi:MULTISPECIES: hypothetical protein [unclassified Corallococcus]|uniref:hypothetical protein n=1 Tax=unclassified Corallococcus TaxID=2685029 RepID=UPI001A8FD069|nr:MULTISPECIES: hypothetical protein [unclassified Corallococcus]MBN9684369.1 hypothetical protein [Corallococcus sp. NCSPR001]WAS84154.1 hypothetical protein O0N60_33285 [Corallococcus sp. NCRR]